MARILGLDLGSHSVKALLLESTFRGYELKRYAEARVTHGGVKAALTALAGEKQLTADQVVVSLPGTTAGTHLLSLPFADPRRIEQTIPFEVEGVVPFEMSEVVFDYQLVKEAEGKSEILVGVARRADIEQLLATLSEYKIDPRVVTLAPLAYQHLLTIPEGSEDGEAIVDIGHERTCIYIGGAKGPEFSRTFLGGGRDLNRLIAADLGVPPETAEALKERQATVTPSADQPDSEKIAGAVIRALSPVVRELRATLRSHSARFHRQVTRVRLTGGTSQVAGLAQHLTRELGVEVDVLSALPLQAEALLKSGSEATASQAFALALRGHSGGRNSRFNLRRGDLAFKGDFEFLKGKILRLAVAAGILLALSAASSGARIYSLGKREARLDGVLCLTTQRVLGKCVKDFTVALSMLKGQGSPAAVIPQISALDLLSELIARTPSDMTVKYDEIEVNLDRIRVRVLAPSFDAPDKIGGNLKTYKCFTDVKPGRIQKSRDGNQVEFDLNIAVSCPEVSGGQG